MNPTPKALLVDDHAIVRRGMAALLSARGFECSEASNGEEALDRIASAPFDLVLLDIGLPGCNGMEALEAIRNHAPKLPVLMVSLLPESHYALRCLRLGAGGFLSKSASTEEILKAVEAVLEGHRYVSPELARILAEERLEGSAKPELSQREFEVLRLIGSGHPSGEIAKRLGLSPKTVGTYRDRIMEKLGASSNADIVRHCLREGLLEG